MKHLKLLLLIALVFNIKLVSAQCGKFKKVPKEFVENRLSGDRNYYGHPYTIFNKKHDGFNLDLEIKNIQDQIFHDFENKVPNGLHFVYASILSEANNSYGQIGGDEVDAARLAIWAKYNAFVLLIGVDERGESMDREHPAAARIPSREQNVHRQ